MHYLTTIIFLVCTSPLFAIHIFNEVDFNRPSIELNTLSDIIKEHARNPASVLSLGESHLQKETVLPIQFDLLKSFSQEQTGFNLCAEHIPAVVNSPMFKKLQLKAQKTFISHGNNPYKTDFKKCNKKNKNSRVYYSGFFHQYPFAQYFPLQFHQTPVITKRNNNIWEQNKKKGLYITQAEMIYLESGVTRSILNSRYSDLDQNLTKAKQAIELLQSQMITLSYSSSLFNKKMGYIIETSKLFSENKELIPEKSYMIFTELAYRVNGSHLHLLEKFQNIKSSLVESIFKLPPKQKYFVSSLQTLSKPLSSKDYSRYGTLEYKFEFGSQFFHFKNRGFSILLVSQPSKKSFDIINAKTKKFASLNLLEKAL